MKLSFLFGLKIITFWLLFINFSNISIAGTAEEPVAAPSWILVKNVTAYSMEINWEPVGVDVNYLVVLSQLPVTTFPIDGMTYQKGDWIGTSKIAYVGKQTSFSPSGIRANTNYFIRVIPFNGSSGSENYLIPKGIEKLARSKGLNYGQYYNGLELDSKSFLMDLGVLLQQHRVVEYSAYKTTLLEEVELLDTTNNRRFVQCVYTGHAQVFEGAFDWVKSGFSREHTFSHSWMPSYPANNPYKTEYSDLHNLYPTHLANANTKRSNYPLDEVTGSIIYQYKEGRLGYNGSRIVYEPSDKQKGNAARAIFYMVIAYNGVDGKVWEIPDFQDQEILKKWHFNDPPDSYEISRQEYIYKIQGNRNPFIDSADFVCAIDFKTKQVIPCQESASIANKNLFEPTYKLKDGWMFFDEVIDHVKIVTLEGRTIFNDRNCTKINLTETIQVENVFCLVYFEYFGFVFCKKMNFSELIR